MGTAPGARTLPAGKSRLRNVLADYAEIGGGYVLAADLDLGTARAYMIWTRPLRGGRSDLEALEGAGKP